MRNSTIDQTGPPAQVWAAPTSEWVAGFVGFSTVIDQAKLSALGLLDLPDTSRVPLRPGALLCHQSGSVNGLCVSVLPGPEATRLRVDIDGIGTVEALGPVNGQSATGQNVRLAFNAAAATALPG